MSAVSDACEKTIREFYGRVEVTWTDATIDETIVADANDKNYIHSVNSELIKHVADGRENMPYKYTHLNGGMVLDGSHHPFPGTVAGAASYTTGWWSNVVSDVNGDYLTIVPELTISFVARAIYSLKVVGDNKYNEYPLSFTVKVYEKAADVTPILTENVVNGVGSGWELSKVLPSDSVAVKWFKTLADSPILSAEKMTLTINKWSKSGEVVKLTEFYTNVVGLYEGDDILSMRITEENEIANGTLPVGNISCNSLDLRLQNIEDQFFVGNTQSPVHTFLKRNRKIRAWIGIKLPSGDIDYTLFGTFFSGDWQAKELGVDVSTQARDRMELLRRDKFEKSLLYEGVSLYALAVLVLEDAFIKIPDLTWNIDTKLQDYVLDYAWFEDVSYFECLKNIAGASMGKVYMDRNDVLQITTDIT